MTDPTNSSDERPVSIQAPAQISAQISTQNSAQASTRAPANKAAAKQKPVRKSAKKTPQIKTSSKAPKLYQRPRGGNARAISDLMPDIGRAAFRRFGFVQSSVVTRWGEIVGERYAEISCPETIRFPMGQKSGGILELTVEGAHATLMQHVIPEIIDRVNRFFGYGAVNRVKIRQGHIEKSALAPAKAPPNLRPVPIELGENLRDIADPELQAVLESLAQTLMNDEDKKSE